MEHALAALRRDATLLAQMLMDVTRHGGRGLHSFTPQLNLSRF